jgi:hypothetical protein
MFSQHPQISKLSCSEQLYQLNQFRNNVFFSYYVSILQAASDQTMQAICNGFVGERDNCAILEREQAIGAAPAYLKFAQLVHEDLVALQHKHTQNDGQE